jgi:hypothetical protein
MIAPVLFSIITALVALNFVSMNMDDRIHDIHDENLPTKKIVISYLYITVILCGGFLYSDYFLLSLLIASSMIIPIRWEVSGRKRYVAFCIGIGISSIVFLLVKHSIAGIGSIIGLLVGGLIGARLFPQNKQKNP